MHLPTIGVNTVVYLIGSFLGVVLLTRLIKLWFTRVMARRWVPVTTFLAAAALVIVASYFTLGLVDGLLVFLPWLCLLLLYDLHRSEAVHTHPGAIGIGAGVLVIAGIALSFSVARNPHPPGFQPPEPPERWVDFRNTAGKFTLQFPATPTTEDNKTKIGTHTVTWHSFIYTDAAETVTMVLNYGDYPRGIIVPGREQAVLDAAREGAINQFSGTLMREKTFTQSGSKGRDIVIKIRPVEGLNKGGFMRTRLLLKGDRLYTYGVLYTAKEEPASVEKFLKSFQLQ